MPSWTPSEIARLFGISRGTVHNWLRERMLPYSTLPGSGYRRIDPEKLIEFCHQAQRPDLAQLVLVALARLREK